MNFKPLIYLILLFTLSLELKGQGFSISDYYSTKDFHSAQQNWDASIDSNQYVYFGTGTGLIQWDGVKWRDKHIGESGRGTSLFMSEEGNFYASGQYDFGTIGYDSLNQMTYFSISNNKKELDDTFNEHFTTLQKGDSLIFYGWKGIEILVNDSLTYIPVDNVGFPNAFHYQDKLLFTTTDGLFKLDKNSYIFLDYSEILKDTRVFTSIPLDEQKVLLGTANNGFYMFDGNTIVPFETEIDDYFKDNFVYTGLKLKSGLIAIGTLTGGLVILEPDGRVHRIYNQNTGYEYQGVLDLFEDHEQTLWVSLWGGIEKRLTNLPLMYYGESEGINFDIQNIELIGNEPYLHDFFQIYSGKTRKFENVYEFIQLEGLNPPTYDFKILSDSVNYYTISDSSIIELRKGEIEVVEEDMIYTLIENLDDGDHYFITPSNIKALGTNQVVHSFNRIDVNFESGFKMNDRYYLFDNSGVFTFDERRLVKIPILNDTSFSTIYNHLDVINDELYVGVEGAENNSGLYKLDENEQVLKKADHFSELDKDLFNKQVFTFEECPNGDVWFQADKAIKRFHITTNGDSVITETPYQGLSINTINDIECGQDGSVWIGGSEGLYQLTDPDWDYHTDFKTNITGIFVDQDSLIYGGFGEPVRPIVLPYEDNQLRFTYAAASYIDETRNTYSVMLEGFDENWSEYSLETQKDYTNIPEGDYIFKVRSKNVFEVDGREDQIVFSVLPPWYRTWWAYSLYFISFSGFLYIAYRIRVTQLLKVERMRTKIARDLHDEVSATLTGISYFAQAVTTQKEEDKKKHFVNLISESASDAKDKISDIVWAITPENDQWDTFLAKCRRYASDLLDSSGMDYELKIPENIPGTLTMQVRQNLWMIYKEMLTNVVRHSGATRVDVILDTDQDGLKLIIQDNGKGFIMNQNEFGNGLKNIRKRAESIKAVIELDSEIEIGTRWKMVVKL